MADAPRRFPVVADLPEVDADAMREVDRMMIEDYGISLLQMMENAGRCLAILVRDAHLGGSASGKRVAVLAGGGGNGGGVLTAARRLATWGADVHVALAQSTVEMAEVPRLQLGILLRLVNARLMVEADRDGPFDVILDGLVGYSLTGPPHGETAAIIDWANANAAPIVALDVPSGFDAGAGCIREPAIRAATTLTIALPKRGLRSAEHAAHVGALFCADISVPPELYRRMSPSLEVPAVFATGDIVQLSDAADGAHPR